MHESKEKLYVCYDLKGIQSYIFAIPKLKYICGGSAIIDQFDRKTAKEIATKLHIERIFSGGGKGAFHCNGNADELQKQLVEEAHGQGLDISIGRHKNYSEAANLANRSFPWLPDGQNLSGHPCKVSGLYPTENRDGIHEMVGKRVWQRGQRFDRYFEQKFNMVLPVVLADKDSWHFIHNVNVGMDKDANEWDHMAAACGSAALGDRNRWAVIAMDGNDVGVQHRAADRKWSGAPEKHCQWIARMSHDLDCCSHTACRGAMERVIKLWAENGHEEMAKATDDDGNLHLPLRPLVVGGDDLKVLCHVRYAMDFVQEACRIFSDKSKELEQEAEKDGIELWPGTAGWLTISAGVLFAPVTLPLSMAIPYAEKLLASAKIRGREKKSADSHEPSPACIDWDSVTEGLIDTPQARRQREMLFKDKDIDSMVELTRRPYTLDDFQQLRELAQQYRDVPPTIRHQILPGMRTGFWDRQVFVARLAKHQKTLAADLKEDENGKEDEIGSAGKSAKGLRWEYSEKSGNESRKKTLGVVDALLLLEEEKRMEQTTARKETA